MPVRNIFRRFAATPHVLFCCASAFALAERPLIAAPQGGPRTEVRDLDLKGDGERELEPDIAACVDGFLIAREWISSLSPPDPESPESTLTLPGVRGVCVILRHEGRIVGTGHDWPVTAGDDRMLRRAVGRALARALGDRVIAALPEEYRAIAGRRLALELEFAGRPHALVGRTIADCALRIDPGLDGIAVRRTSAGKSTWAIAYPSRMLAMNTADAPERTMTALLVELGLPPQDLPELVRIDPVGVFRFSSLRLAQPGPEEAPSLRERGRARVSREEIDAASTAAFALRVFRRLVDSRSGDHWEKDREREESVYALPAVGLGLVGNYIPITDEYRPIVAPPTEQALAAWAAAELATNEAFDAETRAEAVQVARVLIEDLALVKGVEDDPAASVPAMSFALCAAAALDGEVRWNHAAAEFLRVARDKLTVALRAGSANDRALALLAAAKTMQSEQRFATIGDIRARLDQAWTSAPPDQILGQFPWLVIAEAQYARATGRPVEHADKARAVAELLFAVQAGFGDRTAQDDLYGGFRLTGARRASATSQSLRPGLGLTALLAYPGFVPEESLPLYRERAIALLRFARELAVDEEEARFYRSPRRVRDGVRNALWDCEQPVAANALAILTASAALQGMLPPTDRGAATDESP